MPFVRTDEFFMRFANNYFMDTCLSHSQTTFLDSMKWLHLNTFKCNGNLMTFLKSPIFTVFDLILLAKNISLNQSLIKSNFLKSNSPLYVRKT